MIADRYQMMDSIRSGAMGDVYRGADTQTGESVAIKRLRPELIQSEPDMLERFRREAKALRELDHPNIARLIELVQEDDVYYLVMEYVPGGNLADLIQNSPEGLKMEHALSIALELADGLTRVHHLGIIHRDLKPANVLIAADGTPRLTDFGVAHLVNEDTLTQTGTVIGTSSYLSPEACLGLELDSRADIWSYGVMLYEMLTGRRPFEGESLGQIITSILNDPFRDPQELRPEIGDDLNDLLHRMLEKQRDARIKSIRLIGVGLEAIIKGIDLGGGMIGSEKSAFETPTPELAERTRANLPAQSTPFIGRKDELINLTGLFESGNCRLVTLLGQGGIGKTRLGIEAARLLADHFVDGVHFVPLATLREPDTIPAAIAAALDFKFTHDEEPEALLLDYLHDKQLLLVMDNFEHLTAGAGLLTNILASAPGVSLLVTSQRRLQLGSECLFELAGLDVPDDPAQVGFEQMDGIKLFLVLARRNQPGFKLDENDRAALVKICRIADGLPLAIELAAPWIRTLNLEEIASELEADLDILQSERQDIPFRQRSIRAVLAQSWRLLDPAQQTIMGKLAVFQGGFTREAAKAVAGVSVRMLAQLVDRSMIRRDPLSGRFHMHEMMRQYAMQSLEGADVIKETYARMGRYFLSRFEQAYKDYYTEPDRLLTLESEIDNLRTALFTLFETGAYSQAVRLYASSTPLLEHLGLVNEGLRWTDQLMNKRAELPPEEEIQLFIRAGWLAFTRGDFHRSIEWLNTAIEIADREDNQVHKAAAYLWLAASLNSLNRTDEGLDAVRTGVELSRAAGDTVQLMQGLMFEGETHRLRGDYSQAESAYYESLTLASDLGNLITIRILYHNLVCISCLQEKFHQALDFWKREIELLRDKDDRRFLISICLGRAFIIVHKGNLEEAAELLGLVEKEIDSLGHPLQANEAREFDKQIEVLTEQLGRSRFQAAFERGKALDLTETVRRLWAGISKKNT